MLLVCGHGPFREGGDLVGVGAEAASGDGVPQEVGGSSANYGLGGRTVEMVLTKET